MNSGIYGVDHIRKVVDRDVVREDLAAFCSLHEW